MRYWWVIRTKHSATKSKAVIFGRPSATQMGREIPSMSRCAAMAGPAALALCRHDDLYCDINYIGVRSFVLSGAAPGDDANPRWPSHRLWNGAGAPGCTEATIGRLLITHYEYRGRGDALICPESEANRTCRRSSANVENDPQRTHAGWSRSKWRAQPRAIVKLRLWASCKRLRHFSRTFDEALNCWTQGTVFQCHHCRR